MIELQAVSKRYDSLVVIDELSLHIAQGELVVILGGSGSGKSTLLRMMNRLVEHDSGRILFAGEEIRNFKPEDLRRRMGYAIQSVGLFPHWSVEKNIATVPQLLNWSPSRIDARVDELLTLLQLEPALFRHRLPHQLSGGQQQRVGVARALAGDPEVLLMDEPFGALDPVTRSALQLEIARIHKTFGKTIVLVTHDIDEALGLATRIVLLDQGRIAQSGTPLEIVSSPANDFVLDFLGRGDVGIKLLGLRRVADHVRPALPGQAMTNAMTGEPIQASLSLREALSVFVSRRVSQLDVIDGEGQLLGCITLSDLLAPGRPTDKAGTVATP